MNLQQLHVTGYRSIRNLCLKFEGVNVLVGPNGCGKTNLYRAMYLLHRAAEGRFAATLAEEGGLPSALWAGDRTKGPVRMTLEVRLDRLTYSLSCGLPQIVNSAFILDPEIKEEHIWFEDGKKKVCLLERDRARVMARDRDGKKAAFILDFCTSESILAELREPEQFPVLGELRRELLAWRFYHQFRTDNRSPIREPQAGTRTPILGHDGRDLAAALQTILETGDRAALAEAIEHAFPGAALEMRTPPQHARFSVALQMKEFKRPFEASELSDGTLNFLCLLAALLSPRPAALLVINEPEGSIHPNLLPVLAQLIARASAASQVWITTHSENLAEFLNATTRTRTIRLEKWNGETRPAVDQDYEKTEAARKKDRS